MDFRSQFLPSFPQCPNKRMGIAEAERYWFTLTEAQQGAAIQAARAYALWFNGQDAKERKYGRKPLTWMQDYGPDFEIDEAWIPEVRAESRNEVVCGDLVSVQRFWRIIDGRREGPFRTRDEAEGRVLRRVG